MSARSSRKASDVDKALGRQRRLRSSGRRPGRVKVGHDKVGRSKYRKAGDRPPRPATTRRVRVASSLAEWERYPTLAAHRSMEYAQHVARGLGMGLTRKQAHGHARRDLQEGWRQNLAGRPVHRRTA